MGILDSISGFLGQVGGTPSNEANFIQRQLEKQVENLRRNATPKNSPSLRGTAAAPATSPLEQIQQRLFQQLNALPEFTTPIEQLRAQATSQASAQFDPMIQALQAQMGQTTQRARRGQRSARKMYGALARDLAAQLPAITSQMRQAEQETSRRYAQAQQEMQSEYAQQSKQQQALLEQLGIQAAAPEASQQTQADQAYFKGQGSLEKQAALDALRQQQASAETYQRGLAGTSRLAGENLAQDIGQQLRDYLQTAGGQLGGLQSQRASTIESLLGQLQGSDVQAANQRRQQEIDNLMALANFQLSEAKAQRSFDREGGAGADSLFRGTSGRQGAANFLAEVLGPSRTGTASQIMTLIDQVSRNKNVIAGRRKVGTDQFGKPQYEKITNQYLEDLLKSKMEKAGGFESDEISAAMDALMAYLGKLR